MRDKAMKRTFIGLVVILGLHQSASAEIFKIENPASNIYNPATRMNSPNPLSPPTPPVAQPKVPSETVETTPTDQYKDTKLPEQKITTPDKSYRLKTARAYIKAANRAFKKNNYSEFHSITMDALRRIKDGTLKASSKSKETLLRFKDAGNKLLAK
jgi:hypothetical protein